MRNCRGVRARAAMRLATIAAAVLLSAAPLAVEAQQPGKVYRVGFLRAGEPLKVWVDEFRIGTLDQLPQLADDLVRSKVDVIVASASSAETAAKKAATTMPIVFTSLFAGRGPDDFEAAFTAVRGADGLINIDTPLFTTHRERFVELAARSRLQSTWTRC